jgi:hypothetical protein
MPVTPPDLALPNELLACINEVDRVRMLFAAAHEFGIGTFCPSQPGSTEIA